MKRVILILAVLCLVVAMAVPVLATSNSVDVVWQDQTLDLIDVATGERINPYGSSAQSATLLYDKVYLVRVHADETNYFVGYVFSDGSRVDVHDNTTELEPYVFTSNEFSQISKFTQSIDSTAVKEFYFMISDLPCDSSSCSFVDADGDGYCDNCGGFFTPPPPGPLVEVMMELKEQNQLSQVLTQVVTMIPIGLACWVGYKGLRKGLDLLQRILHQA